MGELWLTNQKSKSYGQDWVQKYWENELVQFSLQPLLKKLLTNTQKGIRILELGIATQPSFELMTHISLDNSTLGLEKKYLLSEKNIQLFMGLSADYSQVEQYNEAYRLNKSVRFIKHSLAQGLGIIGKAEPSFDVYFSSQGILSLLQAKQLKLLLEEITQHARPGSLIVLDLLSKYGLRDKKQWSGNLSPTYWCAADFQVLLNSLENKKDVRLSLLYQYDRSIFVPHKRPYLNQLFQRDVRTDLESLKIDLAALPIPSLPALQENLFTLSACWNLLLDYAQRRFKQSFSPQSIQGWEDLPSSLQFGLMTLDRLCKDTEWIAYGDRRANVLEPHIGYVLRSLEYELQQGLGIGSALSYILEVEK